MIRGLVPEALGVNPKRKLYRSLRETKPECLHEGRVGLDIESLRSPHCVSFLSSGVVFSSHDRIGDCSPLLPLGVLRVADDDTRHGPRDPVLSLRCLGVG